MAYPPLHKFRAINDRLFSSLREGTVYFSSPAALNDPFDCQILFRKAFCKAFDFPIDGEGLTVENEVELQAVLSDAKERGAIRDGDSAGSQLAQCIASLYRQAPS